MKYFETEEGKHTFAQWGAKIYFSTARKQLKRFPRYDQITFMNVVVCDVSWIHFFEAHQKIGLRNQVWLTKMQDGFVLLQELPVRKRLCMPYFSLLMD